MTERERVLTLLAGGRPDVVLRAFFDDLESRDDRLGRVVFTPTQVKALCKCGHAFVIEIAPGRSLDVACDALEKNPFVAVGPRER